MSLQFEIEEDIWPIRTEAKLPEHLPCSGMDPTAPELEAIRGMIDNQIDDIDRRWREALAV
jgi:hypothetical protein